MRITHIAAGAAGMYCGACNRDIALVRGLVARGHDLQVIPLYTPLRTEGAQPVPNTDVFMGGVNVYLQQHLALFRRLPPALDRLLDHPGLLRFVSRFAISTDPAALGPMTVSVLAGRDGQQRKELQRLLDFLSQGPRQDLLVLTNSLLSGVAPEAKRMIGVPVVCGLQGEEEFIARMREPYRSRAQELIRRHAGDVDLFIATHEAYAERMAEFLAVPRDRVRAIRTPLDVALFRNPTPRPRSPFVIGYLSSITPGKGLDLLVAAMSRLAEDGRDARLRVAGKVLDKAYWRKVSRDVERTGLADRFEYVGEVSLSGKIQFLRGCSVFSLPSRFAEARGLAAMEAMAAGVPVVVPDSGVFPEMIALTGGGLLAPPEDPEAITQAIARLMDDPEEADRIGRAGAEGVAEHYAVEPIVDQTLQAYESVLRDADRA
jgi:glycosyltransferase involved in cell wall biosynthesis